MSATFQELSRISTKSFRFLLLVIEAGVPDVVPVGKDGHAVSAFAEKLVDIPIYRHGSGFTIVFNVLLGRILQIAVFVSASLLGLVIRT